jgi:hypothetical protein
VHGKPVHRMCHALDLFDLTDCTNTFSSTPFRTGSYIALLPRSLCLRLETASSGHMKLSLTENLHVKLLPAACCSKPLQHSRAPLQQLGPAVTQHLRQRHNSHVRATAYAVSSVSVDPEAGRTANVSTRIRAAVDTITLPLDYYR